MRHAFLSGLALSVAVGSAWARQVVIPLDPLASGVDVEVCLLGFCDADASQVGGSVTIDLDSISAPTSVSLEDFDVQVSEDINIFISLGLSSTFSGTASGVEILYATPGTPIGPVTLIGGEATFTNVPLNLLGTLEYTAEGGACALLNGAGYPCSDTIDLATLGTNNADEIVMQVSSADRVVSVASSISAVLPLDPDNPGLGEIRVNAVLSGSVYVPEPPCPADLNGNRTVDLGDLSILLVHFGESGASPEDGDLNGDGNVDLADLSLLLVVFGSDCPTD